MSTKQTLKGHCHCGSVSVTAGFTRDLTDYAPRACDCDFCQMHNAAYLSDPDGSLTFHTDDSSSIRRYRQGAELADMLFCGHCGVLLGAQYKESESVFGVVNARLFSQAFGETQPASPKQLAPRDKTNRWKRLWFSGVAFE